MRSAFYKDCAECLLQGLLRVSITQSDEIALESASIAIEDGAIKLK